MTTPQPAPAPLRRIRGARLDIAGRGTAQGGADRRAEPRRPLRQPRYPHLSGRRYPHGPPACCRDWSRRLTSAHRAMPAAGWSWCPRAAVSRAYARFWQSCPSVAQGVTGAGLFAVNAAGAHAGTNFRRSSRRHLRTAANSRNLSVSGRCPPGRMATGRGLFSPLSASAAGRDQGVAEIATFP